MTCLHKMPVLFEFPLMKLCPSQHEAKLRSGQGAFQQFRRIDRKTSEVLAVVGMEMRQVMRAGRFSKDVRL